MGVKMKDNNLNILLQLADKWLRGKRLFGMYGQASIEFIFVIPVLFFLMLWTFQFFYAIHTSSVNQKYARIELMKQIDHYRDLRNTSLNQLSYSNDGFWPGTTDYMTYEAYRERFFNNKSYFAVGVSGVAGGLSGPSRLIGEGKRKTGFKDRIEIDTKVGVCRDEGCE